MAPLDALGFDGTGRHDRRRQKGTDMDDGAREALRDGIAGLLGPLLTALETLAFAARHLHPPHLGQLVAAIADRGPPLKQALAAFRTLPMPPEGERIGALLAEAASEACAAYDELGAATETREGVFLAYRALRHLGRANEALHPLCRVLPPVGLYFLRPEKRGDEALKARLAAPPARNSGLHHARNARKERGGFSVYVPEWLDPETPAPLIMALHGGSGHGRDFVWSWLADARAAGAILVSPTSPEGTWSLMEPERDAALLGRILDEVRGLWKVDPARMLLTGMSDGGTFTYLAGYREGAPFTHLAPIAASFHPMLTSFLDARRVMRVPLHIVHGALDWMFPAAMGREAEAAFRLAGAPVVYREIDDLSHTYPAEENARLLGWAFDR